ncbi:ABC transporter ATP-binding protein [Clostridium sp. CTA-19]
MCKFIFKYLKKYLVSIIVLIIISIVLSIISIINPLILSTYLDKLLYKVENFNILNFIYILIFLNIISLALSYVKNIIMVIVTNKVNFDITYKVFEHIKRLPSETINNMDMVYTNQQLETDSNAVIIFILNNIITIIINFITIVIITVMISNISIKISVILYTIIPFYIISYSYYKKRIYKYDTEAKKARNNYTSILVNQLKNLKVLKLNSCFILFKEQMKNGFNIYYKKNLKSSICNSNFTAIGNAISASSTLILLFIGFYEILWNRITVGEFLIINNLYPVLVSNINYFFNLGSNYQMTLVSYNRICEILNKEKEVNGLKYIPQINTIKCKNIEYKFGSKNVIKNFSFKFNKGKIYKIKGDNGKGKSTLINMIAGVLTPKNGSITFNDINIKELNLYDIRKYNFGICEQEPSLISDTIFNNIKLDNNKLTEESIYEYVEGLNLNKNNLNYIINKDNINLSGGEKQKISLVKCFSKNSDIIILDEPISALDSESVLILKNLILSKKREKIIILVAHGDFGDDIADELIYI